MVFRSQSPLGVDQEEIVRLLVLLSAFADEMYDDSATDKAVIDELKTVVNTLHSHLSNIVYGVPALAISTNFNVLNGAAVVYRANGVSGVLAANTVFDIDGVSTPVIADTKWRAGRLEVDSSGNDYVMWDGTDRDDEATAIANLPAATPGRATVGFITVLPASGQTWTAGTDALQGGTGGNPSDDTNYYNYNPDAVLGSAVSSSSAAALSAVKPAASFDTSANTFTPN